MSIVEKDADGFFTIPFMRVHPGDISSKDDNYTYDFPLTDENMIEVVEYMADYLQEEGLWRRALEEAIFYMNNKAEEGKL